MPKWLRTGIVVLSALFLVAALFGSGSASATSAKKPTDTVKAFMTAAAALKSS